MQEGYRDIHHFLALNPPPDEIPERHMDCEPQTFTDVDTGDCCEYLMEFSIGLDETGDLEVYEAWELHYPLTEEFDEAEGPVNRVPVDAEEGSHRLYSGASDYELRPIYEALERSREARWMGERERAALARAGL